MDLLKAIKKTISGFLACIMCIPAGLVNIASAEENDTNTVTTVTLTDTENGLMQFSEECMNIDTDDWSESYDKLLSMEKRMFLCGVGVV